MMNYGLEEEQKQQVKAFDNDNDSNSDSDSDSHSTGDDGSSEDESSQDESNNQDKQTGGENTHENDEQSDESSEDENTDDEDVEEESSDGGSGDVAKSFTTWDGGDYSEQESEEAEESDWDHEHGTKFEINDVADLFRLLNLNEHVDALREEEVDLPALLLLKYEDLRSLGLDNDKTNRLLRVMNLVKLRRRSVCHGSSESAASSLFYGQSPGGASPLEKRSSMKPALSARLLGLNIGADGTTDDSQIGAGAAAIGLLKRNTSDGDITGLKKLPLARQLSDSSMGKHRSVRFSSLDSYDDSS